MALDIIEDAAANKVPVETQFQWFLEAGAPEGRPKKAKTTTIPEDIIDLVSTPPPPSPTPVVKEKELTQQLVSPIDLYKNKISELVKEKFNKDTELKAFIEMLPELF